jgi:hypothetical protein
MYIIYYQLSNGDFKIYHSRYKTLSTKSLLPKRIEGKNVKYSLNKFNLPKGYLPSDEGLLAYAKDFTIWCKELNSNPILNIKYEFHWSHYNVVLDIFQKLCKGKYESHAVIAAEEYGWYTKCYNNGLHYCKPGIYDCVGYDYSRFYPLILSGDSFMIPTQQGTSVILNKLPHISKRKYGIYKVIITCDNDEFRKIFSFSREHTYTHYSINQAKKYQKRFNVQLELIQNGKPNAYVYEENDLITSGTIFKEWYNKLNAIKDIYPKNKLVKHLMSSVWGTLCQKNSINRTEKQVKEEKLCIGMTDKCDWIIHEFHQVHKNSSNDYYELLNSKKPCRFNIRLLPFLTSFARNQISLIALKDLKNVVQINTDGVCFKKDPKLTIPNLNIEDKTTGRIEWTHLYRYKKI